MDKRKGKSKKKVVSKPTMKISRFATEEQAKLYAENMALHMGKDSYGTQRAPKGAKGGVGIIIGVKRPAVVVVTPRGRPRITPKTPRLRR